MERSMKNVTLSFDEQTLVLGKERARAQGASFNAYVRKLIKQDTQGDGTWIDDLFLFMDQHPLDAQMVTWVRGELYERR
jgi:hypothetical protein